MGENSEQHIKQMYDKLIENKVQGFSLVSIKLKYFREYCHRVGHEEKEHIMEQCCEQLHHCLHDDEKIVHLYSGYYLLLIHCSDNLDSLHQRAPQFHFAVKNSMIEEYGKPLYIEMGFYPIIDFNVSFYNAQYTADFCRYGPQHYYPESNYDMYLISLKDVNEEFLKLESKIESALANGHFKLFLQPKVDTNTKEVHCAEALMRWIDPKLGMIPLENFLSNIEDNGSIRDIDIYLFDKGCQYIEKWKKHYGKDIEISFNLSRAYFNGQYFVPEYSEVFQRYDIDGKNICIELLESVVLNEFVQLNKVVDGIKQMGFQCALDDFGSGFSSFDILANVPLSELKLDQSLFKDFQNEKEHVMLQHLIEMAHTFHMRVVAEGIETKEYADYLETIHCDLIQGYYYYKPMPVEEFEKRFIKEKGI